MSYVDYEIAHRFSSNHRTAVLKSETCRCFYCLSVFAPGEIEEWIDEVDGIGVTALCPRCGIDSVIGSASGISISDAFLAEMKKRWF